MQQSSSKRWPLRPLGEVVKTIKGRKPAHTIAVAESGSLPYATADYFRCGAASSYVAGTELDNVVLCRDGVPTLIWDGSNAGEVFIGKRAVLASTMARVDVDEDVLIPIFCHFFLKTAFDVLNERTTGSTIPHVSRPTLESLQIPAPPKPEQEKIAAVLWKVQRAIATQERLIAATRDLKQSAMQRLFTRGLHNEPVKDTEIGPMPESWELVRLGDAYESQLGKMLSQKARVGESPKPYLRNKNVQWGYLDLSDLLRMDFDEREARKFKLEPGDLLVCEGGVIGRAAIWSGELKECYYQKALHRIRPRNDLATNEFLCYWLSFSFEHQNLYSIGGASSTIAHIPQVLLEGLKIPRPDKSEQRAIANTLATIDSKLAHHQKKRAALNDLFRTLLHKLMTAEIRVNHLNIDISGVAA